MNLNDDQYAWVRKLISIKAQRKALEQEEKEVVAAIRGFTHGDPLLRHNDVPVAYDKEIVSRRVDVKMVRDTYPDVAEACTVESVSRQFRIADGAA